MVGTLVLATTASCLGNSSLMTYVICTYVPSSPTISSQDHWVSLLTALIWLRKRDLTWLTSVCSVTLQLLGLASNYSFPPWYFSSHIAQLSSYWEDLLCYVLVPLLPLFLSLECSFPTWPHDFFSHFFVSLLLRNPFLGILFETYSHMHPQLISLSFAGRFLLAPQGQMRLLSRFGCQLLSPSWILEKQYIALKRCAPGRLRYGLLIRYAN